MPKFGRKSLERLETCDVRLQDICNHAIKVFDFTVLEGYRDEETQQRLFWEGKSKLQFPNSKHNTNPSKAIDVAPWNNGINWADKEAFARLAGLMFGVASMKGIQLRWGGTWGGLQGKNKSGFYDLPHFEIVT